MAAMIVDMEDHREKADKAVKFFLIKKLLNSVWFCGYVDGNRSKGVDHMHKKREKVCNIMIAEDTMMSLSP